MVKNVIIILSLTMFIGCATTITKGEAFPKMYKEKPLSILVLPPINQSTSPDAKEYYSTTIAEPLSLAGYYVFPIEIVNEVLKQEGIYDTELIVDLDASKFKEYFGADAVLFTRIIQWNTSYYVVGGNVKVHIAFDLISTNTGEVLWSYNGELTVDTTGGGNNVGGAAGLLLQLAETAVKTAAQDYTPMAKKVNTMVLTTIPFGFYHPQFGTDQSLTGVKVENVNK
ncbi:MAG: DUF799 family lipoprotein [Bacteroidetes bacterium]|jgi:hypothetical protein|nr:DUF799 family lipoprotein [Bacteroidota bacterium]